MLSGPSPRSAISGVSGATAIIAVTAITGVIVLATSSCAAFDSSSAAPIAGTSNAKSTATTQRQPAEASQRGAYDEPEPRPAAGDLANFSCDERRSGRWSASGDITNSASKPMIYTLTVATVEDSDRISAEHVEEYVLKPAESTTFDLPRFARGSAQTCMPRLMRTPR